MAKALPRNESDQVPVDPGLTHPEHRFDNREAAAAMPAPPRLPPNSALAATWADSIRQRRGLSNAADLMESLDRIVVRVFKEGPCSPEVSRMMLDLRATGWDPGATK